MRDHERAFVVCAVEGLVDAAAGAMQALAGSPAGLVLSKRRLAAIGHPSAAPAVAITLASSDAAGLRALAWQRGARPAAGAKLRDGGLVESAALRLLGAAHSSSGSAGTAKSAPSRPPQSPPRSRAAICLVDAAEAMRLCESGPGRLARIARRACRWPRLRTAASCSSSEADGVHEHVAIVIGERAGWPEDVPVRLHSSCLPAISSAACAATAGSSSVGGVAAIHALGGGVLL